MFTVTATISLDYDPADGLITTAEEAEWDMKEYLAGRPSLNNYTITVTEA